MKSKYQIVKTGLNEYDVRVNGITLYECPSVKDCKAHIKALEKGIITPDPDDCDYGDEYR